jgi:hypothetical protein
MIHFFAAAMTHDGQARSEDDVDERTPAQPRAPNATPPAAMQNHAHELLSAILAAGGNLLGCVLEGSTYQTAKMLNRNHDHGEDE